MEYREAVAEARRLVRRSDEDQWRLAQLTYEQVEAGATYVQWARDTGLSDSWVRVLHRTWDRHRSKAFGERPAFSEAWREFLNTAREAEGGQEVGRAKATVRKLPPEQRAEVVREALAEPEVAERIVRDTPTRTRLAKAEHSIDREQQEVARERYELAEPRSVQIGAMADAEYGLTKIRTTAEDVSEAIDKLIAYDWPDNTKERVEVLVQRAAAAVELIKARVEGRDLDTELQDLLQGDA